MTCASRQRAPLQADSLPPHTDAPNVPGHLPAPPRSAAGQCAHNHPSHRCWAQSSSFSAEHNVVFSLLRTLRLGEISLSCPPLGFKRLLHAHPLLLPTSVAEDEGPPSFSSQNPKVSPQNIPLIPSLLQDCITKNLCSFLYPGPCSFLILESFNLFQQLPLKYNTFFCQGPKLWVGSPT